MAHHPLTVLVCHLISALKAPQLFFVAEKTPTICVKIVGLSPPCLNDAQ